MMQTRATLVCFGCGSSIPDGLNIYGQYLCPDCEGKLIHTNINELDYQHWISVCRKFWETIKIDLSDED